MVVASRSELTEGGSPGFLVKVLEQELRERLAGKEVVGLVAASPDWLKESGDGPVSEFDQLLKAHFADSGTTADLRATLAAVAQWARERNECNLEAGRYYLAGEGVFPERPSVNMLVGTFLTNSYVMVAEWAGWAIEVGDDWPNNPGEAEVDGKRLAEVVARAERLGTRAANELTSNG